jgi:hypothetical protein
MRRARARGRRLRVDYFERFKKRMAGTGAMYEDGLVKPNRPIQGVAPERLAAVNQLVDLMIGCKMKGIDFDSMAEAAKAWAEYEWQMVEPALAAKRAAA